MLKGETKINKGTLSELRQKVNSARMQIESNLPYVLEVATEQLEQKISSAVVEFESYVSQSLQAKGLAHLTATAPKIQINSGERRALPASVSPTA